MTDKERERLLRELAVLEREQQQVQRELQRFKERLLRYEAKAADDVADDVEEEVVATPAPPPIVERVERVAEAPLVSRPATASSTADTAVQEREKKYADLEFWLGGRGLLLLGVTALVLAVGFFVNEAIQRGWMGPAARVLLGAGVGVVAVVAGERIRAFGYRTYGLWLAAGGFAAIYLCIWTAAALYSLVSTPQAFALMSVVVVSAGALGLLRKSESLVALAALGGYLAPLLLRVETTSNVFGLGYLALLTAAGLWVAYRGRWLYLASLAVVGGTFLPIANTGDPHLHGVYLLAVVAAALGISRRHGWHYVSLLTVALGWLSLWAGGEGWGITGIEFAAYAAVLWLVGLVASLGMTDWTFEEPGKLLRGADELTGHVLTLIPPWVFFAAAMVGLEDSVYRDSSDAIGFALALVLGVVYVSQAVWGRPGSGAASSAMRIGLGCIFWIAAPAILWENVELARAWLVEGVVFTAAGIGLKSVLARASGLVAFALAVFCYWISVELRPEVDPAFISGWGLTGLAACLGLAAWWLALGRLDSLESWENEVRPFVLLAPAVFFLTWGTAEIFRFYDLLGDAARWELARDLSISSFWMAYAAVLLSVGFWLKQPPVRWVGLGMALIAAGKVFLYDLSQLSELYRIASFVLLAIVLLALSFGYQRLRRA
jgi:uncharacterized membrane protein